MQERESGGTEYKKNLQPSARGAYSAPPTAGPWLPHLQLPLLSALRASLLLFPHSKIMLLRDPQLMQAGDAPECHIGCN